MTITLPMIAIAIPAVITIVFVILCLMNDSIDGVLGSLFLGGIITLLCGIIASCYQTSCDQESAYQERKEALVAPWDELFTVLEQDNTFEIKKQIAERFLSSHSEVPMSIPAVGTFSHIECDDRTNRGISDCAALKSWLVEKLLEQPCTPEGK